MSGSNSSQYIFRLEPFMDFKLQWRIFILVLLIGFVIYYYSVLCNVCSLLWIFLWCLTEMYSLLLETYIKDSREKHRLFNAIENIPCVADKAKWAFNWIQRSCPFLSANLVLAFLAYWVHDGCENNVKSHCSSGMFLFILNLRFNIIVKRSLQ